MDDLGSSAPSSGALPGALPAPGATGHAWRIRPETETSTAIWTPPPTRESLPLEEVATILGGCAGLILVAGILWRWAAARERRALFGRIYDGGPGGPGDSGPGLGAPGMPADGRLHRPRTAVSAMALVIFASPVLVSWAVWVRGVGAETPRRLPVVQPMAWRIERAHDWLPELVAIPGGEFTMGSPESEADRGDDEFTHPQRVDSFHMCKTEITLEQWRRLTGRSPNDCSHGCDTQHPVQSVSWQQAVEFLELLTRKTNELRSGDESILSSCYTRDELGQWKASDPQCTGFRLPTEAEWEYAARAGSKAPYPTPDLADICEHANLLDRSATQMRGWDGGTDCNDGYASLAPVATKKANAWGLHDMHGNVTEWVQDLYRADLREPAAAAGEELRVLRGGSFFDAPKFLRNADRNRLAPDRQIANVGFRCARR